MFFLIIVGSHSYKRLFFIIIIIIIIITTTTAIIIIIIIIIIITTAIIIIMVITATDTTILVYTAPYLTISVVDIKQSLITRILINNLCPGAPVQARNQRLPCLKATHPHQISTLTRHVFYDDSLGLGQSDRLNDLVSPPSPGLDVPRGQFSPKNQ
ncbi:hypothetical protein PoB_007225700 [Plakobranchus ocellatus]|uniref:Uncharacterized protein n=1 Tax=Plakobranchus ocellatus TaxID=259542 RepID=A0AAV4DN57_9GAST|nr:hypothetical protein PoB_007225700 [Plakobranchus ocellatus]